MRARVSSGYYGHLPKGFEEIMTGAEGTAEAQAFIKAHYQSISDYVLNERFGATSYIQKYIAGKLSTEECRFLLTNWALDARACDFAAPDEVVGDAAVRAFKKDAPTNSITALEDLWDTAYGEAIGEALPQLTHKSMMKKARLQKNIALWRQIRAQPPRADVDLNTMPSAAACEQAKITPLLHRDEAERITFWADNFDKDKLTSHLEQSNGVLDIRRLAANDRPANPPVRGQEVIPPFTRMKISHWANSCDILSRFALGMDKYHRCEKLFADERISAVAIDTLKNAQKIAYERIRNLHDGIFDGDEYGDWEDVPMIHMPAKVKKRKAETDIDGGPARRPNVM